MLPLLEDDDETFSLRGSTSGNLKDLFGDSDDVGSGSAFSFQRIAPPKPKSHAAAAPPGPAPAATAADGMPLTVFAALVQVFRGANGAWQPVGQTGLAVVGGPLPRPFQLVLYEPQTKQPFSVTTVSSALGTPSAQYVTLEDDAQQSWSLHLSSLDEAAHLLQHITLIRAAATAMGERTAGSTLLA